MIRKIKNLGHLIIARVANLVYGFPSSKLKVIGVTGTDGKTTTTSLIYHILKTAGKKVSMISTVYAKIGDQEFDTGLHTTTPDSFLIQKLLKKSVQHKDEYFVLETTSHALDQYRVYGIDFLVGIITNITHEHLDYHHTYEQYVKAKSKLLIASKTSLINRDDQSFTLLKKILDKAHKIYITYGLTPYQGAHKNFKINIETKANIKLADFNKYNYLAAYATASLLHIPEADILKGMKTFKTPAGRMEVVYEKEFTVIVDFAHTPNAIYEALKTIRKRLANKGRLIHVFSSAGERDRTKRPLMGKASGEFADIIILTEEDYRSEDPYDIDEQIAVGVKKVKVPFIEAKNITPKTAKGYTIIVDREEAIKKAVVIAQANDVVVVTGKGHEKSLARGNKEYPWSDKEAIGKALKLIKNKIQ